MISAEEAREISMNKHKRSLLKRLKTKIRFEVSIAQINSSIKELADKGEYRASYQMGDNNERILGMLLNTLYDNGYSVEVHESNVVNDVYGVETVYLLKIDWRD